jgi:hypothetical protein
MAAFANELAEGVNPRRRAPNPTNPCTSRRVRTSPALAPFLSESLAGFLCRPPDSFIAMSCLQSTLCWRLRGPLFDPSTRAPPGRGFFFLSLWTTGRRHRSVVSTGTTDLRSGGQSPSARLHGPRAFFQRGVLSWADSRFPPLAYPPRHASTLEEEGREAQVLASVTPASACTVHRGCVRTGLKNPPKPAAVTEFGLDQEQRKRSGSSRMSRPPKPPPPRPPKPPPPPSDARPKS